MTSGLLLTDLKFSLEALSLEAIGSVAVMSVVLLVLGTFLRLAVGTKGGVVVAAFGFAMTYIALGLIWFAFLVALAIFFISWRLALAADPLGSAGQWSHSSYSSSADSFGSDSFGSSSSDSGGFSGDGGSFGGGGASGGW